ncbi:hypothetical protein ABPG72_014485 [Tetrahymena utriculariae]
MAPIKNQNSSSNIEIQGDKINQLHPICMDIQLKNSNSDPLINTNQILTLTQNNSKQTPELGYSNQYNPVSVQNDQKLKSNQVIEGNSSQVCPSDAASQMPKVIKGTNPSWRSWIAAANTMMGSSIVVFPAIFKENGIITSFICMFVVGAFLYKSCIWCVKYCQPHERDLYDTIERLLGKTWKGVYTAANSILLFLVSIIYFLLFNSFFFPLVKYFLEGAFSVEVAQRDEATFDKFSYEWCGIVTISVFFLILAKRDLSFIMKITQYGLLSVGVIVLFAIVKFGTNITNGIDLQDTPLFTPKIYNLIGVFILSFQIHCLIIPILRDNKDQTKNERDTFVCYVITFVTYILISLFGVLAISGKSPINGNPGDTILEYFSDTDVFNIIVRFGLCIYIIGVYPIIVFGSRSNFFSMFLSKQKQPTSFSFLFSNVIYCGCALIAILTRLNLGVIMSFAGYVVSFFIVILLPILIRIKCGKLEKESQKESQNKKHILTSTQLQTMPPITQNQLGTLNEISPKNDKIQQQISNNLNKNQQNQQQNELNC